MSSVSTIFTLHFVMHILFLGNLLVCDFTVPDILLDFLLPSDEKDVIISEKISLKKGESMEKYYTVAKIDGEYAYLRDDNTAEELFIAMALLPIGTDVGTRLKYCDFSFSME